MATIGTFTQAGNGSFAGTIKTLTLNAKATLRPIDKESEKAPDFRLAVGSVGGGFCSFVAKALRSLLGASQPFNYQYTWLNSTDNLFIADETRSLLNGYKGGVYQQASSVVSETSASLHVLWIVCVWLM